VPFCSPPTVIGEEAPLAVMLSGDEVTVYETIAEPPFDAGVANETLACMLPAVAVTLAGASGTVIGVTLFDAADGALVPAAFVAVTVKV
jgi:hypothetical protein